MNKKKKILLLDDDANVRFNLKLYLEDEEFECREYEDAHHALAALNKYSFDTAIVDIRLPDKTGEEFILEAKLKSPSLKFIIYTGSADYSLPDELVKSGIPVDVLHKPVENMKIFIDIINRNKKYEL